MGNKTGESEFTRRKFTIPRRLDDELVRIAEKHYQGNVSLCLRAAFEDHKQTLNGEGEIAFGRLLSHVDKVAARQSEVLDQIKSLEDEIGTEEPSNSASGGHISREAANAERELQTSGE